MCYPTDMYLPETCIRSILERNGFTGVERIFVSGEYKKSKADGGLFPLIKEALGTDDIIHVGDQEKSDYQTPLQNGIKAMLYPCTVQSAREYRPHAMSFLVGSTYRGIVSNYLYNGLAEYSMEYEYGFLYGGLFKLDPEEELTDRNAPTVKRFLRENWEQICALYGEQSIYAKEYYQELTKGQSRVAAVDIGWAGSGALSLSCLFEHAWKLPCEVIGILAGTNTESNAEPDATEPFRQSGKLVSYLFSPAENRDLFVHHDAGKGYNIFWELLLSSTEPQLDGFSKDGPVFGKKDENPEGIAEIRRGILDFISEYTKRFEQFPYMFRIEGRDAYAPMLAASGKQEHYLRAMAKRFDLHVNVD